MIVFHLRQVVEYTLSNHSYIVAIQIYTCQNNNIRFEGYRSLRRSWLLSMRHVRDAGVNLESRRDIRALLLLLLKTLVRSLQGADVDRQHMQQILSNERFQPRRRDCVHLVDGRRSTGRGSCREWRRSGRPARETVDVRRVVDNNMADVGRQHSRLDSHACWLLKDFAQASQLGLQPFPQWQQW